MKSRQENRIVPFGRMLGSDFKISTEPGGLLKDRQDEITVELVLARGGRTLASVHRTYRREGFLPQSARALIDKLLEEVADKARSSGAWLQREMEEARAKLPTLKEQLGKPFAQAGELAHKRERLKEVIKILADATKAAESAAGTGGQISGPPPIADDGAIAVSADEPSVLDSVDDRDPLIETAERSPQ
jgi:hypothetical protein